MYNKSLKGNERQQMIVSRDSGSRTGGRFWFFILYTRIFLFSIFLAQLKNPKVILSSSKDFFSIKRRRKRKTKKKGGKKRGRSNKNITGFLFVAQAYCVIIIWLTSWKFLDKNNPTKANVNDSAHWCSLWNI